MADEPWKDFGGSTAVADKPAAAAPAPDGPWQDFVPKSTMPKLAVPDGWTVDTEVSRNGDRFATAPDGSKSINIGPADAPDAPPTHDAEVSNLPTTSALGAIGRGLQDAVPGIDYVKAAGNEIGTALGANENDAPFLDRVRQFQQQRAQEEAADKAQHPIAHYGAEIAGTLAGGGATGALGVGATAGRLAQAGVGALAGAAYGAGDADPSHAVAGGVEGAATGGALGAVAPDIINFLGAPVRYGAERLGVNRLLAGHNAGIDAMLRRTPQDVGDVTDRAAAMRAAGQQPTILDTIDQGGRDTVAAAGIKVPATREATAAYADARRAALPVDTEAAINRNVSPSVMSTPELREQVMQSRTAVNNRNYGALDPQAVPLDGDSGEAVKTLLNSPAGRRALADARANAPEDVARQVGKLGSWAQTVPFDAAKHMSADQKATMQALADLKGKLPPQAQAPVQAQMDGLMADAESAYNASKPNANPPSDITHAVLDKVRKAAGRLATRASSPVGATLGDPGNFIAIKNGIGAHIDAVLPEAAEARAAHGAYSRVLNAIDGSGGKIGAPTDVRPTGSDFVTNATAPTQGGNYQNFEPWANSLSDEHLPLHHADGRPILDANNNPVTINEQQAARSAAANAMRTHSQAPAPALSQARNFYDNNAQNLKSRALLGDTDAAQLSSELRATARRADNAKELAGRSASPTARLKTDSEELGEGMHALGIAAGVASHGMTGLPMAYRGLGQMMRRGGLNPRDAEDLVNRAIDPSPTAVDDFIEYLGRQNVSRDNARQLFATARRAAAIGGAGGRQSPSAQRTKHVTLTGE